MSNEFVASVNPLENLPAPDPNQQDPKRDVESLDRRFGSLMSSIGEINRLNFAQSAQTNNVLAMMAELWKDHRRELCDMSNRIRALEDSRVHSNYHKTRSTHDKDSSDIGDNVSIDSANNLGGNELGTEEHVNGLDATVPSTSNEANLTESTSGYEQVNGHSPNLSSVSTTIDTEHDQNSKEVTLNASKMEIGQEDDEYHEIDVAEGGGKVNNNQMETLHEESIGNNQSFENGNQIDQQVANDNQSESNSTINENHNESPTSKQCKTRKRKRTNNSRVTKSSSLENSLISVEASTQGPTTRSKRARVSSSLSSRESAEQVNTGSGVDPSDEDGQNGGGIDSSGEGEVERSEDEERWLDSETELGNDDDDGGNYEIEILKMKCTEKNCNVEVASRVAFHLHLQKKHNTSLPHRCLAEGCEERFEQWTELGPHIRRNHLSIPTWPCAHCAKTYKSQKGLFQHLHLFHFEGVFRCGYDGCRVATLRSELFNHQKVVHPKALSKIYTCQINNCGKSFTRKDNLGVHQGIHQNVKPFKCTWNMCDYTSTQQYNVIKHIRIKHFGLPVTQKEQHQRGIVDNRKPRNYLLNTITHQSDHSSTDSDHSH